MLLLQEYMQENVIFDKCSVWWVKDLPPTRSCCIDLLDDSNILPLSSWFGKKDFPTALSCTVVEAPHPAVAVFTSDTHTHRRWFRSDWGVCLHHPLMSFPCEHVWIKWERLLWHLWLMMAELIYLMVKMLNWNWIQVFVCTKNIPFIISLLVSDCLSPCQYFTSPILASLIKEEAQDKSHVPIWTWP